MSSASRMIMRASAAFAEASSWTVRGAVEELARRGPPAA